MTNSTIGDVDSWIAKTIATKKLDMNEVNELDTIFFSTPFKNIVQRYSRMKA